MVRCITSGRSRAGVSASESPAAATACSVRGLLVLLVAASLSSCGPATQRLRLGFRVRDGHVELETEAPDFVQANLYRGMPWTADLHMDVRRLGIAFSFGQQGKPETKVKLIKMIPAGGEVKLTLKPEDVPVGEWVFQVLAQTDSGPVPPKALSDAVVVTRTPEGVHARRFFDLALERQWVRIALTYGGALAALMIAFFLGFRRLWLMVLLALLTAGIWHRLQVDSMRSQSEFGGQMPPILWPENWQTGGDHWARTVGSEIEPLVSRLLQERSDDEPVTLVVPTIGGLPTLCAMRIRLEIREARVRLQDHNRLSGLLVYLGCRPTGLPIYSNKLGSIIRLP